MSPLSAKFRWKVIWRTLRIARQSAWQVAEDAAIYGTGAVLIDSNGNAKRIDPASLMISTPRAQPNQGNAK